jgi:hypothetical protein
VAENKRFLRVVLLLDGKTVHNAFSTEASRRAMTVEHASAHAGAPEVLYERVPA